MIKVMIYCWYFSFTKLVWLQLHPKLIASDYITIGRPLGRTKGVHSCVTPKGAWSGGSEAWLANPNSLTYFNTNDRANGLGKTSWYATCPPDPSLIRDKLSIEYGKVVIAINILQDVISHPCLNFHGSLAEPPLKEGTFVCYKYLSML